MEKLYSGMSGIKLPIPKYQFPPEFENASRLTYYSTLFNSIEVNSSFYKIPTAVTVAKWAQSIQENFKFTYKLWRGITHAKGLMFEEDDVLKFIQNVSRVENKAGALLIQLPPSASISSIQQLERLVEIIMASDGKGMWALAIEFRHKSWYNDKTYTLLDKYGAAMVIHDKPNSVTPFMQYESPFIYLRFHGPTGDYKGSYAEEVLSEYAQYVVDWVNEGKVVYVYFNNTAGDALQDHASFLSLVAQIKKEINA
jgi:uncharacterized protein YecE (DUF72 family)